MLSLLRDTLAFLTAHETHPVARHEAAGWSAIGFWRRLQRGCLPLTLALILLPAVGCGLFSFILVANPLSTPEDMLGMLLFPFMGLLMGGEIVRWVAGLLASVVAATTISAEVEAQTYGLLRLTSLPVREIVLAKYSSSVRQMRIPIAAAISVRFIAMLGIAALVIAAVLGSIPDVSTGTDLALDPTSVWTVLGLLATGAAVLSAVLSWLAYYLVSPISGLLLFAALGMLASAWSRTRSGGVAVAVGMRFVLWMASYVLSQIVSVAFSLLGLPLMALTGSTLWEGWLAALPPVLLGFGGATIASLWVLGLLALQVGVTLALLALAINRAERLPNPR